MPSLAYVTVTHSCGDQACPCLISNLPFESECSCSVCLCRWSGYFALFQCIHVFFASCLKILWYIEISKKLRSCSALSRFTYHGLSGQLPCTCTSQDGTVWTEMCTKQASKSKSQKQNKKSTNNINNKSIQPVEHYPSHYVTDC